MGKSEIKNCILLKVLCVSIIVVSLCSFLGPYDYQFRSIDAIAYYYFCFLLLAIPLIFCSSKNRISVNKRGKESAFCELTIDGERTIMVAAIIAIMAALLFTLECMRLFPLDVILAGGDFRADFSESRSTISKYCEIVACLGPATYLIVSRLDNVKIKGLVPLAFFALISMGLTGLLLGARWKIFLCLLILFFSLWLSKKTGIRISGQIKSIMRLLACIVLVALVLYAFYILFSVRGTLAADEQYRFYYGDMPLKSWAYNLYSATHGAVDPIYKAIDYIGQSPYVFSYIFIHFLPDHMYYGAYAFRVLGDLFSIIGIPFPSSSEIARETFTGMYSGSAYGIITDFGVIFTPVVFLLIGLFFASIERRRIISRLASVIFPLVCGMIACSPVYYFFHVGYADYILWCLLVLYGFVSLARLWLLSHNDKNNLKQNRLYRLNNECKNEVKR